MDTNDQMPDQSTATPVDAGDGSNSEQLNTQSISAKTVADRRAALRLGLAGMPMMLTLRASANSSYVSQLRCTYVIECGYIALVDMDGAVWLGNPGWGTVPDLTAQVIEDFKNNALVAYPAGTAPSEYIPNGSDCDPCTGGDPADEFDFGSDDLDDWFSKWKGKSKGKGKGKGKGDFDDFFDDFFDDDDDDDDSGGCGTGDDDDDSGGKGDDDDDYSGSGSETTFNCAYTVVEFPCNDSFTIGDGLNVNGNVTASGLRGFWLELATSYVSSYGEATGFPGASCLVSVLQAAGRI